MTNENRQSGKQILWYIRRNSSVKGPFPSGTLRRFLILGRVLLNDYVSRDRENWVLVSDTPEVIPPELRKAMEEGTEEQLLAARLREDERTGRERRTAESDRLHAKRRQGERRQDEDELLQQHRSAKTVLREQAESRKRPLLAIAVLIVVVMLTLGYGFYLEKPVAVDEPDCRAVASAGVNWRNCRLDGLVAESANLQGALMNNAVLAGARLSGAQLIAADLQYADLAGADLSYADLSRALLKGAGLRKADITNAGLAGADLSFADLTGATIGGAVFAGAELGHAIWVDGTVCQAGSVGSCVKAE
ncbi:MAG: hypothetical protein C0631_18260 [Sedimenticola sp.]|nr:MAG: hypothetical protein C0631_18260 [Sedimenticola sp.]